MPARDVEDYAQEALLRLVRSLEEQPGEDVPFEARWKRIAECHVRDFRRRSYRRHERLAGEEIEIAHQALQEADVATLRTLEALLAPLDPLDREIILRHDCEGVPLGDIAAAHGITEAGAAKRRQRALEAMRATVERWRAHGRPRRIEPAVLVPFAGDRRSPGIPSLGATPHVIACSFATLVLGLIPPAAPDTRGAPSTDMRLADARLSVESASAAAPAALAVQPPSPEGSSADLPALHDTTPPPHQAMPGVERARPAPAAPAPASAEERDLIGLARAALGAGDEARSRYYLDQHQRRFRGGPLAPAREALLRKLERGTPAGRGNAVVE